MIDYRRFPISEMFHKNPVLPDRNLQEDDAKFREFSKRAEDGPSRARRLSETFLEVLIDSVYRAAIQNRG